MLALAMAWAMAVVVYVTAPGRVTNRRLALVLLVEGAIAGGAFGLLFLVDDPGHAYGLFAVSTAAAAAVPFLYLAFLGAALDTPLVRPFRSRRGATLLALAAVGAATTVVAFSSAFGGRPYRPGFAEWNVQLAPWGQRVALFQGIVAAFALVAAIAAFRRASPGTSARHRARWFAIAFGVRDVYAAVILVFYPLLRPVAVLGDLLYNPAQGLVYILYVVLLAYGVLRAQLFDIDLRIKWTMRRGTLAAVFLAVFFVVATVASEFLTGTLGYALGGVAAGLLLFFLAPLQRLAERVSDRAMPGVRDDDEYRTVRKREVYRAAVESALQDGVITEKERDVLATLAERLGLSPTQARALEREAQTGVS